MIENEFYLLPILCPLFPVPCSLFPIFKPIHQANTEPNKKAQLF